MDSGEEKEKENIKKPSRAVPSFHMYHYSVYTNINHDSRFHVNKAIHVQIVDLRRSLERYQSGCVGNKTVAVASIVHDVLESSLGRRGGRSIFHKQTVVPSEVGVD